MVFKTQSGSLRTDRSPFYRHFDCLFTLSARYSDHEKFNTSCFKMYIMWTDEKLARVLCVGRIPQLCRHRTFLFLFVSFQIIIELRLFIISSFNVKIIYEITPLELASQNNRTNPNSHLLFSTASAGLLHKLLLSIDFTS